MKRKKQFELIVESMPNALILSDKNGKIMMANQKMVELFGYTKDELYQNTIGNLIPKRYTKHHPENMKSFFLNPSTRAMGMGRDLFGLKKNGDKFPIEIGLSPIKIKDNHFVIASIIDITERKEQENKIYTILDLLKIKNRELEEFSYITSHDLQEPLRTISNFTMLINEEYKGELDGNLETYINFISESATRMSTLISKLLDYSRLGNERKMIDVNCDTLIKNILNDLSVSISDSKAKITFVDPLPTIKGSEVGLQILFQNLISNALKFQKKNIPPHINIFYKEDAEKWLFCVQDNGIGIKEKDLKKIFIIFQRLHDRDSYEGTGIGLAFCRKIVEVHNGNIWVDSELGKGSSFYFTISKVLI